MDNGTDNETPHKQRVFKAIKFQTMDNGMDNGMDINKNDKEYITAYGCKRKRISKKRFIINTLKL